MNRRFTFAITAAVAFVTLAGPALAAPGKKGPAGKHDQAGAKVVVVTPAPFVQMQVVGTQTVLLWRPPAGWQLQRSTDFAVGSWLPVSGTPAPGGRFETSRPSTGREFFRLVFTGLAP